MNYIDTGALVSKGKTEREERKGCGEPRVAGSARIGASGVGVRCCKRNMRRSNKNKGGEGGG